MKLFLIDGHALVFKMYYAFLGRPMINSKGLDTSILFGFTKYLLELIAREDPTHIAVAFDPSGGTFRNKLYPLYKANRTETPQLVIDALEPLTEIVGSLGIPVLMIKGFEADDVIGSMAVRCAAQGADVYMVTPDKDYGQLVAPSIYQYKPGKSGSDNEILDSEGICRKWKIDSPSQVIDILTICGDASDNVPGVPGVGPVGAAKLLSKYGSVEEILAHKEELTARQQEMFASAANYIGLSKKLVTIKTDILLETTLEEMKLDVSITPEVSEIFSRFEFPSLLSVLRQVSARCNASGPIASRQPEADLGFEIVDDIDSDEVALTFSASGILYLASEGKVSCGLPEKFRGLLEDKSVIKIGFDLKSHVRRLAECGIELHGRLLDVELMHYLINPERSHALETIAKSYLGVDLSMAGHECTGSLFDPIDDKSEEILRREVYVTFKLAGLLSEEISSHGLGTLYEEIEAPLITVLAEMERIGVKVDVASLDVFANDLRSKMLDKEREVRSLSGLPNLNVSSPKQVGIALFEKMQLDPKAKKPRNGNWPTDEQTLRELSGRSPIIGAILDYRSMRKLLSSYIEPFPGFISAEDGRVHTCFNQALTATGRLSSSNPNLQNIPVRTEMGREIRKAFVPQYDGWVMMSADYSQIELRIMAHLCGDGHLIDAFRRGEDVHSATAAKIFHVNVSEVTPDQRRVAKTANFGIMYGISAFGLSQRLGCNRTEAKQIIDDYFESFPSIRRFIDETVAFARTNGFVETIFGRRRYLPDINSQNAALRAVAERNAVNAPIQGTAADIIKMAMIRMEKRLCGSGMSSRMVLQIHDELLLEVPLNEIEMVRAVIKSEMENVISLSVPLTVECNYGKTWLEAH